ncbi:hypothetical protein [Rhizobium laguerreae]|uniref:hypothetical protein n=1 Tax=Rhizobium laguerreae TaxID=1076926 RepID=UPI001C90EC2E|nr:hypothetical protein [Rhizobium laguerreae]MBY3231930.1 hypothetical protein [Rhizobium laguerreae]
MSEVTQEMRQAADKARNEWLTRDGNDQIGALNAALDAAFNAAVDGMPIDKLNAATARILKAHNGPLPSETICVIEEELLGAYLRSGWIER